MASNEETRKLRIAACRVTYRDSVYADVKEFEQRLRKLFKDRHCSFFGRRIGVLPDGRACYDVVIDLKRRRQISDIERTFRLEGDEEAKVDLYSYPAQGDTGFVGREVGNVCIVCCGDGMHGLWFGELHERIGVCARFGKCVEDDRIRSGCVDDDDDHGVGVVLGDVVDRVSSDVEDIVCRQKYSMETVNRAAEVVRERLQLAQLRFVQSLMQDRITQAGANPLVDVSLVESGGQVDGQDESYVFDMQTLDVTSNVVGNDGPIFNEEFDWFVN